MIAKKISHYNILEKLGEGGMGVVYKALDTNLNREVAIKFLPRHIASNKEEKERFKIEARAAAALNYPGIATIHAIEEEDDEIFIVMEYINGVELKEKIETNPLSVSEAIKVGIQLAKGLQAAHEKGIIHRDIKSANIMLTIDGQTKIMDFGLAKLSDTGMVTRQGTTLGTFAYMSPEQAQGMQVDNRTDLWSLGVVFYEMFTGELPFRAEHEAAWIYTIINEQPKSPSLIRSEISQQLDMVVLKLLEKNRESRIQSAGNIVAALQEIQNNVIKNDTKKESKSIAVLPFENISADKENDYFSDGLTEELIANLTRLKDMKVIARTTTMQYKNTKKDIKTIGRELSARYIIEGSVRKFQDNLRITAQLIDVESGTQLWAETYKGKLADVFDIQEEVSKQIVDAMMLKLSPTDKVVLTKRSTVNPEAFDCYLRARNFLYRRTKNGVQFAIQLFQEAIGLDPRYASAFAGLGEAYATLHYDYDSKDEWIDKAIESSLKALMYDSTLAEAYAALGLAYFSRLSLDEAVTSCRKAIELDPNNFVAYWILGRIYHRTDRDKDAIELYKKAIELNSDFHTAYGDLRMIYERIGDKDNYQATLNKLLELFPRYLSQHPDDARTHIYYATDLAQVGRTEEAKVEAAKALELSPGDPLMLYNAACCYSRMNEKELAINSLAESIQAGLEDYEWILRDPDFENIRQEPEYIELMKDK